MSGGDVSAWQRFLTGRTVFSGSADGVYGAATVEATRSYQNSRGLHGDGVVGLGTYSQAVRDGFGGAEGAPASPGMDAAINCTHFAAGIAAAGMKFVVRYYSRFPVKAMNRAEALALSAAGLQLAAVYQDANDDIRFFSADQGRQAATRALAQAAAVGQPAGSAIYFAADFNPSVEEVNGPMADHYRAVTEVFAAAPVRYAVGVYGSGMACRMIRDAGLAQFTWVSNSGSFRESDTFRAEAHMVQVAPSRTIFGGQLSIDDDIAQRGEFGAFRVS